MPETLTPSEKRKEPPVSLPRLTQHPTDTHEVTFMLTVADTQADLVKAHLESLKALLEKSTPVMSAVASPKPWGEEKPMPPGLRLKALRQAAHRPQKAIAELLGVNQSRISDLEQGVRPITPEMAVTLARYFNVAVDEFLA